MVYFYLEIILNLNLYVPVLIHLLIVKSFNFFITYSLIYIVILLNYFCRLKAVEDDLPHDFDDISPRDNASTQPSIKSTRPSVVTATTDDSRYQERRELEDLIDALERENE